MEGIILGQIGSGGINIDGVIEQAKARGVVNARGFCEVGRGIECGGRYTVKF